MECVRINESGMEKDMKGGREEGLRRDQSSVRHAAAAERASESEE